MDVRDLISTWKKEMERNKRKLEKREKIKTGHCKRINGNWHVASLTC